MSSGLTKGRQTIQRYPRESMMRRPEMGENTKKMQKVCIKSHKKSCKKAQERKNKTKKTKHMFYHSCVFIIYLLFSLWFSVWFRLSFFLVCKLPLHLFLHYPTLSVVCLLLLCSWMALALLSLTLAVLLCRASRKVQAGPKTLSPPTLSSFLLPPLPSSPLT